MNRHTHLKSLPLSEVYWFQEGPGVRKWQFTDSGIKLLNVGNIEKNGTLNLEKTDRHLSKEEVAQKYSHFLVDEGDLVIASSGISFDDDGLLRTRGAFVEKHQLPLCLNTSTIRFKAVEGISELSFLRFWLDSREFRSQITKLVTGSAQQNFGPSHLKAIKIKLPPIAEQKRIAEILDRTQSLISKRKEAIAKLDTLTQSIFLEMFGDPVANQKKWKVINMSECAERIQIGPFGTQLHEEDYIDNGIPLINPTHMKDGKIFPNSAFSISSEKHQQLSQYHLEIDDVILGRRGEMGRCAIISENENGWLCGTGSLFIRPKHELLNSFYLFCVLSSQPIKKYLEKASQGVTMANLNKTIVSQIPMAIPPLSLQKEFAQRVEAVEKLKATHLASLSELQALFASLQHRAFRGEL